MCTHTQLQAARDFMRFGLPNFISGFRHPEEFMQHFVDGSRFVVILLLPIIR